MLIYWTGERIAIDSLCIMTFQKANSSLARRIPMHRLIVSFTPSQMKTGGTKQLIGIHFGRSIMVSVLPQSQALCMCLCTLCTRTYRVDRWTSNQYKAFCQTSQSLCSHLILSYACGMAPLYFSFIPSVRVYEFVRVWVCAAAVIALPNTASRRQRWL